MATVIAEFRAAKSRKAVDLLEDHGQETLIYYGDRDSHWPKLRTNNPLERIMREIRRRTRAAGARHGTRTGSTHMPHAQMVNHA